MGRGGGGGVTMAVVVSVVVMEVVMDVEAMFSRYLYWRWTWHTSFYTRSLLYTSEKQ